MRDERQSCFYILASRPYGAQYIGLTSNLLARLWQNRNDALAGFTSEHKIHMLVRFEMFGDMEGAIAREKQLKRWRRPWKINLIQSDNPQWLDLAAGLGLTPLDPRERRNGS